jgi:hypothetical protein
MTNGMDEWQRKTNEAMKGPLEPNSIAALRARIEALEAALRAVVNDIHEYERINQLAPSPGKTECWQSVAHAMTVLSSPPKAST